MVVEICLEVTTRPESSQAGITHSDLKYQTELFYYHEMQLLDMFVRSAWTIQINRFDFFHKDLIRSVSKYLGS